jgi:hypothetical protein
MIHQIRKRENVTLYLASDVAELDDEIFKKLEDNPYTGNSEEEFLKYISDLDLWNISEYDLDEYTISELEKIGPDGELKEFANSAEKSANTWLELGEKDENYRRYGGFNARFESNEQ